jgi:serine phosphatase RsbU (regulator of sigma subunit)
MRQKFRHYFIGEYLQSGDVFEQARAIMLLQFSVMFLIFFTAPLAIDFAYGYHKAVILHLFTGSTLILFPFMIKWLRNLDRAINLFFIICFIASSFIFMMMNPASLDVIGISWTILFLFLSSLLQKGFPRLLYCFFLGWLPLLYVIINTWLEGAITWKWLEQPDVESPPVLMAFVPIILGMYAIRSYTRTLGVAKETILDQKSIIEEKNKSIHESISYARHLQEAILPPLSAIGSNLENSFVLYLPKDIVAGDFYWFEKAGSKLFIAAGDCTGHGVPGAMVSVICSGALNRAVSEYKLTDPGKILDKTRELVIETFKKSKHEVRDGMDISLLVFETDLHAKAILKIEFAGANNNLYLATSTGISEIKADKQPIGKTEHGFDFKTTEVPVSEGMTLYLATDGYADQFGGSDGKKLKTKRFFDLLNEAKHLPIQQQSVFLKNKFLAWQGELEQVDDVCIIGIQI